MKYVVTGAGIVGSALATRLRADGHDVMVLDRVGGIGVTEVDLRDAAGLRDLLPGRDGIFHTAAIHGFRNEEPAEFFDVNLRGTWTLCEAALACNVRNFVHSSTVGVFGEASRLELDGDSPLGNAVSPYNVSKQLAEELVSWYTRTHGLQSVALRYGAIRQTIIDRYHGLPLGWAMCGAVVDLVDVVEANVQAMARLPLPRFAYLIVPSGGSQLSPYTVDSTLTSDELGLSFSMPYEAILAQGV